MYTPTQTPPNLDVEGLRKWVAEEFTKLSRSYQLDTVPFDPTTINASITTLNGQVSTLNTGLTTANGNITTLQGQVTTLNGQVAQANDVVSFSAGATALATNTPLTVVSGSVPIGTWDLYGHLLFSGTGSTSITELQGTIGTVANTVNGNLPDSWFERRPAALDWNQTVNIGPLRVVLGAATTYRLTARGVFTVSTLSVSSLLYGRRIMA